ncbi:MAG TPA: ABC transporter permease [Rectinemataceae bacterium]|nr:ABC transporter permease [Rectinemataceae bacterium]
MEKALDPARASEAQVSGARTGGARRLGGRGGFREGTTILVILGLGLIMTFLSPYFLTVENFRTMFMSFAINGMVVIAMTLALISGGIDLSVGAVMALVGIVVGTLFLNLHMNIWLAALIGIGLGLGIGLINGLFITKIGLSPFITTLGMMQVGYGVASVVSQGMPLPLQSLPASFKFIGRGMIGGTGMPFVILLFLVVVFAFDFLSRRATIIRKIYYVGSNEKSARFSGINVNKVRLGVYMLVGALAAFAGILSIARFNSATNTLATTVNMDAISAAVIGGASLNGGEGTIFGSVLGIALLALIQTSLNLMDVGPYWQSLVTGLVLLIAVSLDFLSHRKSR